MTRLQEAVILGLTLGVFHGMMQPARSVPVVPNFGSVTSYASGTAGDLAGTIGTDGAIAITAGGAGSTAVGQFVSEITVID